MKIASFSVVWPLLIMTAGLCAVFPAHSSGRTPAFGRAGFDEHAVKNNNDKNNFDGPAELPRVYVKTSLAETPAPGKGRLLKGGENLQSALDAATCGETIEVESGATFTGRFVFPRKPCDDRHWIVIRTSAPDQRLPAEGVRLTPCYAGVPSLPGRPDFHCVSPENVMAKIAFGGRSGSGPIFFADGANHYRFIGVEITRAAPAAGIVALALPEEKAAVDHIIFDRVWMHGTEHDDTRRGLFLRGTTYIGVVDSYFSDFHCDNDCSDSQAIGGGGGDIPNGFYKISNNFLEASGENILFGGGDATVTPSDIEIRHNHLFKPIAWLRGQPDFMGGSAGHPFIVKNLFELKNAQRVLFEDNILEGSWGGFSQAGFAIVLTPKNQGNGKGENVCPLCRVTDITIRYCKIAHVGGGFNIANVPAGDVGISAAGERYSIHDVVIDDIDGKKYAGFGTFMLLLSNAPTLKDVKMDHITAISSRVLISMGIRGKVENFTFTNNLIGTNEKEITSAGGGPANCAFHPEQQGPVGILQNCFNPAIFKNNVIIGGTGAWPPGNFLAKDTEAVGFQGADLRLCLAKGGDCRARSKYVGAGTDGKDVGADIGLINAATKDAI
jgi:hypothetical protein